MVFSSSAEPQSGCGWFQRSPFQAKGSPDRGAKLVTLQKCKGRPSRKILTLVLAQRTASSFPPPSGLKFSNGGTPPNSSATLGTPDLGISQRWLWGSGMFHDVEEFVATSSVCSHGKSSHRPPAGLLQTLPVPFRPLSHTAIDFVTGLPPSEGNKVILMVVE